MTLRKVRAAVSHLGLPGRKIGRVWYFDEEAVKAWLANRDEQQQHERRKRIVKAAKDDPSRYRDEFGEDED